MATWELHLYLAQIKFMEEARHRLLDILINKCCSAAAIWWNNCQIAVEETSSLDLESPFRSVFWIVCVYNYYLISFAVKDSFAIRVPLFHELSKDGEKQLLTRQEASKEAEATEVLNCHRQDSRQLQEQGTKLLFTLLPGSLSETKREENKIQKITFFFFFNV